MRQQMPDMLSVFRSFCPRVRWKSEFFFFSSRRRHTRLQGDWSSDVCSSDLHRDLHVVPDGLGRGEEDEWDLLQRRRLPLHHQLAGGQPRHQLAEITALDDAVEGVLVAELDENEGDRKSVV